MDCIILTNYRKGENQMKRDSAILLMLVLLLAAFIVVLLCGGFNDRSDRAEAINEKAEEIINSIGGDGEDSEQVTPLVYSEAAKALGLEPEDTVMSLEDSNVSWRELAYWMGMSKNYYEYYYGEITDWDADLGGMTVSDYVLSDASEMALLYHAIEVYAKAQGVSVTDKDVEEIEAARQDDIEYYGGEEAYLAALEADGLTDELYRYMNEVSALYTNTFIKLYGENGELLTDAEVMDEAMYYGYMAAKHILLMFPEEATDEDKAEIHEKAQKLRDEINSAEDKTAKFDELMNEHSEDTGLVNFPEGYTFMSGDMVAEFENAVLPLDDYGISEVVESVYGCHIIMRLPLSLDGLTLDGTTLGESLRPAAAADMLDMEISSFIDDCEITYADIYDSLSPKELFN